MGFVNDGPWSNFESVDDNSGAGPWVKITTNSTSAINKYAFRIKKDTVCTIEAYYIGSGVSRYGLLAAACSTSGSFSRASTILSINPNSLTLSTSPITDPSDSNYKLAAFTTGTTADLEFYARIKEIIEGEAEILETPYTPT